MIKEEGKIKEYYHALLNRDSQYAGVFFVGVHTTKVFCISTCRARKPKLQNVVFYDSAKEALQYGFRPCKVCKPTENLNEPPVEVKHILRLVSERPEKKIKDEDLRDLGYAPEKIRRWFKTNFGITFQAYQRMIRINAAYERLKRGNPVTNSAFQSGYESLSGFGYTFKNLMEASPEHADRLTLICWHRFTTPLGPMYACATDRGLCLLEFTDRRMLETEIEDLVKKLKAKFVVGENEHTKKTEKQIVEYFDGKRKTFDITLDMPGTEFQQKAWKGLLTIPFGSTRSYAEQARRLQSPLAVRAVANANGQNRISIIVPCHRIIGADGSLTGYGGGLPRKKWLLEHESSQLGLVD